MTAFLWLARGVGYVPAAAAAFLLCWLARRAGCDRRWSFAGCALVAVVAGLLLVVVRAPVAPGTGSLMIGFGWGGDHKFNVWQALVPLAICLFFTSRTLLPRRGPHDRPASAADDGFANQIAPAGITDSAA
jgi:hypothetical protein